MLYRKVLRPASGKDRSPPTISSSYANTLSASWHSPWPIEASDDENNLLYALLKEDMMSSNDAAATAAARKAIVIRSVMVMAVREYDIFQERGME